jgi:hypothetical protein
MQTIIERMQLAEIRLRVQTLLLTKASSWILGKDERRGNYKRRYGL